MKKFKDYTLNEYVLILSRKEAVPGGGSVSALTGANAVALLLMVTEYSKGRFKNNKSVEVRLSKIGFMLEDIRDDLLDLVDADSEAYRKVIETRKGTKKEHKKAMDEARSVVKRIGRLCYKAVGQSSYLVEKGNPYLLSDVAVAVELLFAAYNGAKVLSEM